MRTRNHGPQRATDCGEKQFYVSNVNFVYNYVLFLVYIVLAWPCYNRIYCKQKIGLA